ncbi:MAG: 4Fe-4S dicluster domain-containing protein [bacterium]
MNLFFISSQNLLELIRRLSVKARVFYPFVENDKSHLIEYNPNTQQPFDFSKIRTAENIKHFLFPSRDIVARFPRELNIRIRPQVIIGVKNCDLRGIEVYDRVFLNWQPTDLIYKERRENTIIISADCPEPEDSCFCNLLGLKPYATGISDANISVVKNGYLFETFTEKGMGILNEYGELFATPSDQMIKERETGRKSAEAKLEEINKKGLEEPIFELIPFVGKKAIRNFRNECVECFACLHACPTCYCFLLSDYKKGENVERVRVWDACYYAAYARVGGGANPRSRIDERFWNRFQCKFSYFYQYEKIYACSGCGRCFLGCSAKIDIREILINL